METAAVLSTAMTGATLRLGVALVLAALLLAAVARLRPLTRGTTLLAPWWWAVAVAITVNAAVIWNASQPASDLTPWVRYLAGATLLAPPMAVLGAKRPQDGAWQWVVLSLVTLAILPAAHQWLFHPGSELRLEPAWQWFVLVIAAVGVGNYLITARALAAALVGVGMYCFLGEQIPGFLRFEVPERDVVGLAALAAGALLARRLPGRDGLAPHDRLWRDFRDDFGAAWALRSAERFNAAAAQAGWGTTLAWGGFGLHEGQAELTPAEAQCFDNLLRRFVDPEWIAIRVDGPSR
jgi:hypothetical protein